MEPLSSASVDLIKTSMIQDLGYCGQWERKIQILEEVVEQLKWERDRVGRSVDEAHRNGEGIYENVTRWLSTASKEIYEAEQLIQMKEAAKKERCAGVCPNLMIRYRLSKQADKKASAIGSLVWAAAGFGQISLCAPVEQIVESSVFAREALPSRLQILEQITDALKAPELTMIGVYGLAGVGKTTLAREVLKKATEEKIFESGVLVDVSRTPEVGRIQEVIAQFLGMKFDTSDELGRASQLYARLAKSEVLIVLDDLRGKLDLNAVGIPYGDFLNCCKLLLTSREVDVLHNEMGTQKEFHLDALGEEEALKLFCIIVNMPPDPRFQDIATKIAKRCARLPLFITMAAMELRDRPLDEWIYALKQISEFGIFKFGNNDTHQRVNKNLATISENQHGEEMKSLLLLCFMFGQSDIEIKRLLLYSMGLGLFKHTDTVRGARDRLFTLIDKLKAKSSLLDGDTDGSVKMDDKYRNAAISSASTSHHLFVGSGQVQLRDQLDRNCTKISLPYCNVSELPSSLDCPGADLFLLFAKDQGLKMPHSFFEGMRNLKVVDITGMRFIFLPSSLGLLTNLQTLSLQKCRLHDVSLIGKLKQLQQLSFAYSRIVRLPKEIQELTQLKLLDLSNCTLLQVIPADVLSGLCHLEELYMLASFKRWGTGGNASLEELTNLKKLSTLEIQIENPKLIPRVKGFFDGLKLKHFKLSESVVDEASTS